MAAETALETILRDHRDEIVSTFVTEIQRKDLSPVEALRSVLVDHVPAFIDDIVRELRGDEVVRVTHDAIDTSAAARSHGVHRWKHGWSLDALVREYGILRHVILDFAKNANATISIDEFEILAKCLNVGVAEAVTAYSHYRDEELAAQKREVEFLAQAGQLLSSSLDRRVTLTRLTGIIVPELADWCAVHIDGDTAEEMGIVHVDPAKADVVREIYRRFPVPQDSEHGYPAVLRTGQSQLVERIDAAALEAAAQSPEHLELLRSLAPASWMVVPLQVERAMFGAITFVFGESGRHYRRSDLLLAEDLARRAAVALDNTRLYELSQEARIRVEAATRAKDEFVAMISHELRTPLNAILGWMQLEKSTNLPDAKRERARDVIERNAVALNQLVGDLLDISRAITGSLRLNPAQIDLSSVIDLTLEGARPALEAKRIHLDTSIDRSDATTRGDADRLQQVIWNLLSNAIKFTPKGGRIWLSLVRRESDLELVVRDDGLGIEVAFLPFVFDSFRQSDTSATRAHGGLGVGLSIAQHIVQLHGGTIEVASEGPGRGATFTVRLPVGAAVSSLVGVPRVPVISPEHRALPKGLNGVRALVVDDDDDARELVGVLLGSAGIEVVTARNVEEALKELDRETPDVVVSDIGMPGSDGYAFVRAVRRHNVKEKASVPAIALTAYARNEDRTRALLEGFNVHIAKPVEPATLVLSIAELLGKVPASG